MKTIDTPVPCAGCAKRKNKKNPYERVSAAARTIGVFLLPLGMVAVVVAYVLMIMWGVQNGQYETVEVTKVVQEDVNPWIMVVTIFGGFVALGAVFFFFISLGGIRDEWDRRKMEWDRRSKSD